MGRTWTRVRRPVVGGGGGSVVVGGAGAGVVVVVSVGGGPGGVVVVGVARVPSSRCRRGRRPPGGLSREGERPPFFRPLAVPRGRGAGAAPDGPLPPPESGLSAPRRPRG